jgi:hypothetical protein
MSYVYSAMLASNTADNTAFRAWGSAISSSLANSGWAQANDAGQINWTTVTANGTGGNVAGYEIWHMNDALQAAAPVYCKFSYGTSITTNGPRFSYQMGSGSDTIGNLTGPISATYVLDIVSIFMTPLQPCFFSGANNRFAMSLYPGVAGNIGARIFTIERTHDAGGNDTTYGVLQMQQYATTGPQAPMQVLWSPVIGTITTENFINTALSTPVSSTGYQTAFYPAFFSNGVYLFPALSLMMTSINTVTIYSPVTLPFYGGYHTYIPFRARNAGNWYDTRNIACTATQSLMLWE